MPLRQTTFRRSRREANHEASKSLRPHLHAWLSLTRPEIFVLQRVMVTVDMFATMTDGELLVEAGRLAAAERGATAALIRVRPCART